MTSTLQRFARIGVLAAAGLAATGAWAQTAICYNCPTEWADWGTQLRAIKAKTGITVPADNKNSGQALAQLVAEKGSPVADVTYLGVTFAIQAQKDGVVLFAPATLFGGDEVLGYLPVEHGETYPETGARLAS